MNKNLLKNPVFQLFLALGAVLLGSSAVLAQFYGYYPQYGYGTQYASSGYVPYGNGGVCPTVLRDLSLNSIDREGDSSVSTLQSFLVAQNLGVPNLTASGFYDVNTQSAVAVFQSRNGISPTGSVGPQTRAALSTTCSYTNQYNPYQYTQYQSSTYQYQNQYQPYDISYYGYGSSYSPNNSSYGYNSYNNYTYPYSSYTNQYASYPYSGQYPSYTSNYTYPYSSYGGAATITSLSSSAGSAGQLITIAGSGFAPSGNIVQFGGISITDQQLGSSNGTTLTFRVPTTFFPNGCSFSCASQLIVPGAYPISVSSSVSGVRSNSVPFTLLTNGSFGGSLGGNQSFNSQVIGSLITSVNGPTSLSLGTSGTWTVTVNNTTGGPLSVLVRWGDELQNGYSSTFSSVQNVTNQGFQTLTFTHSYNQRGTFPILFSATGSFGFGNGSSNSTVAVY